MELGPSNNGPRRDNKSNAAQPGLHSVSSRLQPRQLKLSQTQRPTDRKPDVCQIKADVLPPTGPGRSPIEYPDHPPSPPAGQSRHSARLVHEPRTSVVRASLAAAEARATVAETAAFSPHPFILRQSGVHPHRQGPGIPPVCESEPAHVRASSVQVRTGVHRLTGRGR